MEIRRKDLAVMDKRINQFMEMRKLCILQNSYTSLYKKYVLEGRKVFYRGYACPEIQFWTTDEIKYFKIFYIGHQGERKEVIFKENQLISICEDRFTGSLYINDDTILSRSVSPREVSYFLRNVFPVICKKDENFYIGKIRYGGYKTYKKDDEPIYYASIEVGSLLGMSNSEVLTRDRPSRIPEELKLYCSYKNGKMAYDVEKSNIIDIRVVNDTLTYLLLICDHSIIERLSLDYLTDPIK